MRTISQARVDVMTSGLELQLEQGTPIHAEVIYSALTLVAIADAHGSCAQRLVDAVLKAADKSPWVTMERAISVAKKHGVTTLSNAFVDLLDSLECVGNLVDHQDSLVLTDKSELVVLLRQAQQSLQVDTPDPAHLETCVEALYRHDRLTANGFLRADYEAIIEQLEAYLGPGFHPEVSTHLLKIGRVHVRGDGAIALQKIVKSLHKLSKKDCIYIKGGQLGLVTHLQRSGVMRQAPRERAAREALRRLSRASPLFERLARRTWVYHLDQLRAPSASFLRAIRSVNAKLGLCEGRWLPTRPKRQIQL